MTNLVFFAAAVLMSGFFSGSETAFISANRIQLEVWSRHRVRGASRALNLLEKPDRFLTTTLVGNNIAVVAASFSFALILESRLSGFSITILSTLILLLFGEMLPKSIARDRAASYTRHISVIIDFAHIFLYPVIWVVNMTSLLLLRVLGLQKKSVRRFFSRKDLDVLIRQAEQTGLVDAEKRNLISRFILRGQERVREAMIHRTEIIAVKNGTPVSEVANLFDKTGYTRIPVYRKNIDDIIGIVTAMDVLLESPKSVNSILREVLFVPEHMRIAQLLRAFQTRQMRIAIVVDEYGGTAGLVTFEDIIEEFFGEIQDEFDEQQSYYRKTAPRQLDVHARIPIDELNLQHALQIPQGPYQTLGGYLSDRLGRIPKRGDRVEMPFCTFLVISASRRQVKWVRVAKKPGDKPDSSTPEPLHR